MNKYLLELKKIKKNFNHKNGLIELFKNVSIKTNNEVAFSDKALYNRISGICKLFGNVKLQRGTSFLTGDYAEMDLNKGISKLMPAPGRDSLNENSFIVNVGCGKPISILQLANALSKINAGFNFKIGQPRQVEIPTSYADIRKLLVILQSLNQSSPPSNVNQIAKSIRIEES